MNVGASVADAPDRGTDVTRDTDPAADDATPVESDALNWLPERVELPSDERVIYPPGKPRSADLALRFEKTVPAVPVGIDSDDSPGVHVLSHPDDLSVLTRFGGVVNDSVREFEPPSSDAEHEAVAVWMRTWVEHVDDRAERAHIRTARAPVPNASGHVSRVLFDHFGSTGAITAAVLERNTAALTRVLGAAEQTATDLVIHYGTDAEWEHYRRHRDVTP